MITNFENETERAIIISEINKQVDINKKGKLTIDEMLEEEKTLFYKNHRIQTELGRPLTRQEKRRNKRKILREK